MAPRFSTSMKTWRARIAAFCGGAPIEMGIIGSLKRAYVDGAQDVRDLLICQFRYPAPAVSITKEQEIRGRAWLMSVEIWNMMTPRQQDVMNTFTHFEFVGIRTVAISYGRVVAHPVYRVHGGGAFFDYMSSPYQDTKLYPQHGHVRFEVIGGVK